MKKGRNKKQIVKAIFKLLHKKKDLYLSSFRKIGLDNPTALKYFDLINVIAYEINQTVLIEVETIGKTTSVRLNNGVSTTNAESPPILHTEDQMSKIIHAIELATNKLAFTLQMGESVRKKVTVDTLKEAEKTNEAFQNYLSKQSNDTLGILVRQKNKTENKPVFAELKNELKIVRVEKLARVAHRDLYVERMDSEYIHCIEHIENDPQSPYKRKFTMEQLDQLIEEALEGEEGENRESAEASST